MFTEIIYYFLVYSNRKLYTTRFFTTNCQGLEDRISLERVTNSHLSVIIMLLSTHDDVMIILVKANYISSFH